MFRIQGAAATDLTGMGVPHTAFEIAIQGCPRLRCPDDDRALDPLQDPGVIVTNRAW